MKNITFKQFQKLDIRVGTIVDAEVPEWSHYVMKLTVDVGPIDGNPSTRLARSGQSATRTVFAGIMNFFKPKDLIGKQSLFIVNLEPKKMGPEGDYSEGMMLMAVPSEDPASLKLRGASDETTPPILLAPKKKVPNGTKIE